MSVQLHNVRQPSTPSTPTAHTFIAREQSIDRANDPEIKPSTEKSYLMGKSVIRIGFCCDRHECTEHT